MGRGMEIYRLMPNNDPGAEYIIAETNLFLGMLRCEILFNNPPDMTKVLNI